MPSATAWWVGAAGQHPAYLLTDGVHVGGTLAQVGVGQRRPLALDVGQAAGPGRERADARADPRLDVGEHLGVGEQRQVGVEDAGLGGADLAHGEGAQVLDVAAYLGDGLDDAAPLGRRVTDRGVVGVGRRGT